MTLAVTSDLFQMGRWPITIIRIIRIIIIFYSWWEIGNYNNKNNDIFYSWWVIGTFSPSQGTSSFSMANIYARGAPVVR